MLRRISTVFCIIFLLLGLQTALLADYEVALTIPLYGQENSIWSGPACAQMIFNGYPDPYPSIYFEQSYLWTFIQTYNSGEPGWATDPEGMRGTLMDPTLNPPQVGIWSLKSYDVREELMFQILFWMNYNSYPVTTLVNSGYHWVDVVGYVTDIEPVWGSDPELLEITIHDPWPIGVGQVSTMTGTVWYDTRWQNPVTLTGTWYNKYVALIEPPDIQGSVSADLVDRRGTPELSEAEALQYSENYIDQLDLAAKHPSYAALDDGDTQNLEPILVREEITFEMAEAEWVPYYYIIPYAKAGDNFTSALNSEVDQDRSSISVIINGSTGDFEEVASFGRPVEYLPKDEAIKAASGFLKLESRDVTSEIRATMVFTPCNLTYSRAYPFWRVETTDQVVYVDLKGKVYTRQEIIPQLYGR